MQQTQRTSPNKTQNISHATTRYNHNTDIYSSIGKMVPSKLPSAPEYSIGKAERQKMKKVYINQTIAKADLTGTGFAVGPNSYFPSQKVIEKDGKKIIVAQNNNKQLEMKYSKPPVAIIGTEARKSQSNYFSHYNNQDKLQVNDADKNRKQKSTSTILGKQKRFRSSDYNSAFTPSPLEYRPPSGTNYNNPPKYSFAKRAFSDPKLARNYNETPKKRKLNTKLNDPGPGSYFTEKPLSKQNKTRSQSVNFLRTPQNSNMRSTAAHKFPKSSRNGLDRHGNMQQTYDIKSKTIMAHYDFQNDGGKGFHSGLGWLKDTISAHAKVAVDKFKMRSYSIGKTQRGQAQRGIFKAHMEFKPAPIRIQHPKF